MSTTTLLPTLFHDLTAPKWETTYPATDLIYKQLHHIGADVSSFRRNCQVSYRLVEYVRDLYDEINVRIHTAEESGKWEHYNQYNHAINAVEEILRNIMKVTEAEREEYLLHGTGPDLNEYSIESWIKQSIADWFEHRNEIRECLDGLRTQGALKGFIASPTDYEDEIQSAKVHDDRTLLQNLLRSIGENEPKLEGGKSQLQMIRKVKENLQSTLDFLKGSPKNSLEDDLSVLAIKCAMIACGVTELMKHEDIKAHPSIYHRLYGNVIWDTAQKLAGSIHDHLKRNEEAPNLSELHTTYKELEAALTGEVAMLMPDAYHRLFPLVGKIGRAYRAQSLVLASFCQEIALHYESNKNFEARDALERALVRTIDAFTAAGELNNGSGPIVTGNYDARCERLYDESLSEIKACYDTMKLSGEPDLQGKLNEARIKDQMHFGLPVEGSFSDDSSEITKGLAVVNAPETRSIDLETGYTVANMPINTFESDLLGNSVETNPHFNQDTIPSLAQDIIRGAMPVNEILRCLVAHGCRDISKDLDTSRVSPHLIANGGFGDVYRANLCSGALRAARELYVWSKCKHPNVLELSGVAIFRGQIAISPWVENGHLRWFLSRNPQANRCMLCVNIADGVDYLHKSEIVHGDLKPENILVADDHIPKLIDFGSARLAMYTLQFSQSNTTQQMTPRYSAPEIFQEERPTEEGDIYALGTVIFETISKTLAYDGLSHWAIMGRITSGKIPSRPEEYIPTGVEQADRLWLLITSCWAMNPSERPKAWEVKAVMEGITPEGLRAT